AAPSGRRSPQRRFAPGGQTVPLGVVEPRWEVGLLFLPPQGEVRRSRDGGWFPPTMTSVSRSARAARYYHELAHARAPLGGPERPPVPPASLRSGGTNVGAGSHPRAPLTMRHGVRPGRS